MCAFAANVRKLKTNDGKIFCCYLICWKERPREAIRGKEKQNMGVQYINMFGAHSKYFLSQT